MLKNRNFPTAFIKGLVIVAISIPIVLFVLFRRGNDPELALVGQIAAFIFASFFALGLFNTLTAILGVRESFLRQYLMTERGKVQREHNREEKLSRALYFFCLGTPALILVIILQFF